MSFQSFLKNRSKLEWPVGSKRISAATHEAGLGKFSQSELLQLRDECHGKHNKIASRLLDQIKKEPMSGAVKNDKLSATIRRIIYGFSNDRKLAVLLTDRLKQFDDRLKLAIDQADSSRDSAKWAEAEFLYYKILEKYPHFGGYFVQYGHCLKEQGKHLDAEIAYRNAYSLGEVNGDLIEHMSYCATKNGVAVDRVIIDRIKQYWSSDAPEKMLDSPPIKSDIEKIYRVFLGVETPSLKVVHEIMTSHAKNSDVVRGLIRKPEFVHANRALIRVVFEQSQGL